VCGHRVRTQRGPGRAPGRHLRVLTLADPPGGVKARALKNADDHDAVAESVNNHPAPRRKDTPPRAGRAGPLPHRGATLTPAEAAGV
jgi:hypothetical protein